MKKFLFIAYLLFCGNLVQAASPAPWGLTCESSITFARVKLERTVVLGKAQNLVGSVQYNYSMANLSCNRAYFLDGDVECVGHWRHYAGNKEAATVYITRDDNHGLVANFKTNKLYGNQNISLQCSIVWKYPNFPVGDPRS